MRAWAGSVHGRRSSRRAMVGPTTRSITRSGPSASNTAGTGKPTLLPLAGGVDKPDGGGVLVAGTDLAALSAGERARLRRRHVGFVFQFFHLIPTLTVAENVGLPLVLDRARSVREPVAEML